MDEKELLKYAVDSGILDIALVQKQVTMQKREKLLNKNPYKIYQGKDENWYSYLPDEVKGRRKIKAKRREAVEQKIIDYWKEREDDPTVEEIFNRWISQKLELEEISRATYDRYLMDFQRYFDGIKDKRIKGIDECELETFIRNSIHDFNMTSKAFSNFRTLIYGIFKYAKRKKYVKFSITYTLKDMDISPKAFKHVVRQAKDQIYMPDEKERMEMYLRNHLDIVNLGLLFMFKTGVRVGELSALKRKDVENYTVAINSTETRYRDDDGFHYEVKDFPKSEAGLRFAILPDKYKWILDEVRKRNPFGEYLFERNGERLKSYNFRERLRYICEHELRMKVKSPHKIRKTYGSILLDGKVKESTILDTMGHTDISCTKDHYYFDRTGIEEKRQELGLIEAL